MATTHAGQPVAPLPGPRKELLEKRAVSFYKKDVAHTLASEAYDKRGRWLGLVVVILSTIVGTSVFASLQGDPSTAAKVGVGVLSVLAALAAAVKEYQAYEKLGAKHGADARALRALRYSAEELLVALGSGGADKEIDKGLVDLDAKAKEIEETPLPKGYYAKAEEWVDKQLKAQAGGYSDVL